MGALHRLRRRVRPLWRLTRTPIDISVAIFRVFLATRSQGVQPETIVLGDSHSCYVLGQPAKRRFTRYDEEFASWWIGPKLMYSIAKNGWPTDIHIASRLIKRKDAAILCIFGEIDVRVFLGSKWQEGNLDIAFIDAYVDRCRELSSRTGSKIFISVPVPPYGDEDLAHEFPKVGSLSSRVEAHGILRSYLIRAVSAYSELTYFDPTKNLTDQNGVLRAEYSDDGFHLNERGSREFRRLWRKYFGNQHLAQ